jgi:hypothetical protein
MNDGEMTEQEQLIGLEVKLPRQEFHNKIKTVLTPAKMLRLCGLKSMQAATVMNCGKGTR